MLKRFSAFVLLFAVITSNLLFSATAEGHKVIWSEENWKKVRADDGWEYMIYYKYNRKVELTDEIEFITVCGYNGEKSDITIPTEYNGFSITEIEPFYCADSVKTIRIPKEIISIHLDYNECGISYPEPQFSGKNLREFIVSKSNKNYKSVSGVLYTKDGKSLIRYPSAKEGKSFTIPSKVEYIRQGSLVDAKYLKNLTISENVTGFGENIANGNLKKLYFKNTKLTESDFTFGEYPIFMCQVKSIYVFKDSGIYDYYAEMNSENVYYKNLKLLSKPTKPERTEIKKIRRTSKGIKITLKDVKCSYQKVYRYSSKTKKYEYIGTTKTKTFYDTTAKPNKTYKYKARACNKKNFIKANGRYSKVATIKK